MLDCVKVTLILGLAAVIFGAALLGYFAYMNTGSRNISFAVAALSGAIVMLFLNLLFDLQGSTPVEHMIPTEYTLDLRTPPRIRQWVYPPTLGDRYMTLPPETTISITSSSVTVSNPFCKIVFDVERSGGFAGRPIRRGDDPMLESGEPTFWTWTTPIRVKTQYSRWRAQHRDKQKYQDWAQNLVEGVRGWFGTVTDHSAVAFDADEESGGNGLKLVTTEMRN